MTVILRNGIRQLIINAVGLNVNANRVPYDDSVEPALGADNVQEALDALKAGAGVSMEVVASANLNFDNDGDNAAFYTVPASTILIPWFVQATKVSGGDAGSSDQFSMGKNASRYDMMGSSLSNGARTLDGLTAGAARLFTMMAAPFYSGSPPNTAGMDSTCLVAGNTITLAKLGGSGNGHVAKIGLVGILIDV
jgi:hypothetical protein